VFTPENTFFSAMLETMVFHNGGSMTTNMVGDCIPVNSKKIQILQKYLQNLINI
jgi:hypothetical protein